MTTTQSPVPFSSAFVVIITMILLLATHSTVKAKVNFVKDQSMDAVFPGPVFKQDTGLPEGHMRPLGWQRRADGPVEEEQGMLSTKEFYEAYIGKNTPVVFRNGLGEADAFSNWNNDSYVDEKYGDLNVTVRIRAGRRRNKLITTEHSMKLSKFLREYLYEEWYVATGMPEPMMSELSWPSCVRCGNLGTSLLSTQLWMSSGGTSSRIHSHDEHLLHCVVFGRRDFIVIEAFNKKAFEFVHDFPGSLGGHSDLNTEMINMFDNKQIGRVPWTWATLRGGDCIFIPAGYIHHVRSHGRTISYTLEFPTVKKFDDTGCTLLDDEFVPLSEAKFFWKFEAGKMRLSDESLTVEGFRELLTASLGTRDSLTFEQFEHFYKKFAPDSSKVPDARQVFDFMLSEEEETVITRGTLKEIPDADLQRIVDVFQSFTRLEDRKGDKRHAHEEF